MASLGKRIPATKSACWPWSQRLVGPRDDAFAREQQFPEGYSLLALWCFGRNSLCLTYVQSRTEERVTEDSPLQES